MGIITVKLKVSNPKKKNKTLEKDFLVDSGAQYTVLPENDWKKLDIQPTKVQSFGLADGRVIKRKIGWAFLEYENNSGYSPVVLGKKNDSNLLGVVTLEMMGLALDPFQRKIYKAKLLL
ncbi:hypothetical protein A3J78_01840 [Candidatus Beckwithbacteria bacterium RBG_13_35_6]|uniref:Peptidase A2 domain-containing protein n=1 Tax=Candidatus Beckwithbacteria bacterium RBG_13_35_6 TaxID=1797456 RepID=A0A1F5DH90_9BACT|nr:MAG: hypothetical protein A3J78_01840 [Candidatus Beckwithbacteria bacterium RBG_13_35_6]